VFIEFKYQTKILSFKQAQLVLPDSDEEFEYLASMLKSNNQFNATAFYWIGQPSRFQLSVTQSSMLSD
jgi:hypothetical protein